MIHPAENKQEPVDYIYPTTCDIETGLDGRLLAVSLFYDGCIYEVYNDWEDWVIQVLKLSKKHKNLRTIWAHNGANYDWQHLVEYLNKEHPEITSEIMMSGTTGISVKLSIEKIKYRIWLRDSLRLLPMSLEKLARDMQVETQKMKIDLPHEQLFREKPDEFYQYLKQDTISLAEILYKFHHIINEKICLNNPVHQLKSTVASMAMECFRREFLNENILVPWNEDVKKWERKAYHGGMVSCPRHGVFQNCTGLDVNSMYPYAMTIQELPTGSRVTWVKSYYPGRLGIYYVEYELPEREFLHVYNESGILAAYGKAYLTSIMIADILENGGKIKVIEGLLYKHTGFLLKDYANRIFSVKSEAKTNGQTAIEVVAKLLLNSLYGKFAQKDISLTLKNIPYKEVKEKIKNGEKIWAHGEMYMVEEEEKSEHTFVGIAAFITDRARILLMSAIRANRQHVLYADTDSIIGTGDLSGIDKGSGLGQWKVEFSGCEFVVLGRKTYAIIGEKGIEKIRAKGISFPKFTESQKFEEEQYKQGVVYSMRLMATDISQSKEFTFLRPPTNREVFIKGEKSALWREKTRTIRATSDEAQMERQTNNQYYIFEQNERKEQLDFLVAGRRELISAIRTVGGIASYSNGYRRDEYKDIPLFMRNGYGLQPDVMAEVLATDYPHLGITSENDLYDKCKSMAIWRMNNKSP